MAIQIILLLTFTAVARTAVTDNEVLLMRNLAVFVYEISRNIFYVYMCVDMEYILVYHIVSYIGGNKFYY